MKDAVAISRAMTVDRWKVPHKHFLKVKTIWGILLLYIAQPELFNASYYLSVINPSSWFSMLAIYWDGTQAKITLVYQMVFQQLIKQHLLCTFVKQPFY